MFIIFFIHIPVTRQSRDASRSIFRFSTSHAGQIYQALTPELSDEVNPRSMTRCWLEGEDTLVLKLRHRILRHSGQRSTWLFGW